MNSYINEHIFAYLVCLESLCKTLFNFQFWIGLRDTWHDHRPISIIDDHHFCFLITTKYHMNINLLAKID